MSRAELDHTKCLQFFLTIPLNRKGKHTLGVTECLLSRNTTLWPREKSSQDFYSRPPLALFFCTPELLTPLRKLPAVYSLHSLRSQLSSVPVTPHRVRLSLPGCESQTLCRTPFLISDQRLALLRHCRVSVSVAWAMRKAAKRVLEKVLRTHLRQGCQHKTMVPRQAWGP